MPLIHVTSNLTLSDAEKSNALKTLSQAVAELLDKPEKIVMTSWTTAKMTPSGDGIPCTIEHGFLYYHVHPLG